MRAACANFETELVAFNGDNHHVHLLANLPPKVARAKLVNSLTGVSSRRTARYKALLEPGRPPSAGLHPTLDGALARNPVASRDAVVTRVP